MDLRCGLCLVDTNQEASQSQQDLVSNLFEVFKISFISYDPPKGLCDVCCKEVTSLNKKALETDEKLRNEQVEKALLESILSWEELDPLAIENNKEEELKKDELNDNVLQQEANKELNNDDEIQQDTAEDEEQKEEKATIVEKSSTETPKTIQEIIFFKSLSAIPIKDVVVSVEKLDYDQFKHLEIIKGNETYVS